jgi:hypothetical protein
MFAREVGYKSAGCNQLAPIAGDSLLMAGNFFHRRHEHDVGVARNREVDQHLALAARSRPGSAEQLERGVQLGITMWTAEVHTIGHDRSSLDGDLVA